MVVILSKFIVLCQSSYFVFYFFKIKINLILFFIFLKSKLILFHRVIYYYTGIFLIFFHTLYALIEPIYIMKIIPTWPICIYRFNHCIYIYHIIIMLYCQHGFLLLFCHSSLSSIASSRSSKLHPVFIQSCCR